MSYILAMRIYYLNPFVGLLILQNLRYLVVYTEKTGTLHNGGL